MRQTTTFVCAASVALVVLLSVFSNEAITLLAWKKPEYAAAACVVPLLALSQALQGLAAFTEAGISLGNRPAYISGIALTAAAANIGLNFLLVPRFGLLGAGWATLTSFVLWNALHIYFSRKFYRIQFDVRRFVHAGLVGRSVDCDRANDSRGTVPVDPVSAQGCPGAGVPSLALGKWFLYTGRTTATL